MTTIAREYGQDVAHERLFSPAITITEPGYVYIYVSNEQGTNPYEVYFDQLKVDHVKSQVIQTDDYYPFGLTFNSYQRENTTKNNYLYNGKELQDELDLGWMDYGARMYQPEIGRWGVVDPLNFIQYDFSPYHFGFNNPITYSDPSGMIGEDVNSDLASTFITIDGTVIEHRDDDDNNVYLVLDPENWDGKKTGLPIAGHEDPSKSYKKGDKYSIYSNNSVFYSSWQNFILSSSLYGVEKGLDWYQAKNTKYIPVWDEFGQVIGFTTTAKTNLTIKGIKIAKGVMTLIGIAGEVVVVLYNVDRYNEGEISGERLTYSIAGAASTIGTVIFVSSGAGLAVGAIFLVGETLYDIKQSQKSYVRPEREIHSVGDLKRQFHIYNKYGLFQTIINGVNL